MFFLKIRKMQMTITAMIKRPNDFISFINIPFHFLVWIAVVVIYIPWWRMANSFEYIILKWRSPPWPSSVLIICISNEAN